MARRKRDDLDEAQDNFQDAAGDTVDEAGNVMEETWKDVAGEDDEIGDKREG
jgi:hypothetical protein